jgi:Arc/MetJ-type ribon-helix-helix transcriptional regulator
MNVKVSIELPARFLEFAEGMVRDGAYGSLSELVEEHLRHLMLMQSPELSPKQKESVMAMKNEIVRRMNTPKDQWFIADETDKLFRDLRRYADEKIMAGR